MKWRSDKNLDLIDFEGIVIIERSDKTEVEGEKTEGLSGSTNKNQSDLDRNIADYLKPIRLLENELTDQTKSEQRSSTANFVEILQELDGSDACFLDKDQPLDRTSISSDSANRVITGTAVKNHYPRGLGTGQTFKRHEDPFQFEFSPDYLTTLLDRTLTGQKILQRAKLAPLSEASQNELSAVIAEHHLNAGRVTTEHSLNVYAEAIICLLIHEKKEDYFVPRKGDKKNPSGKLYNKITNLKQKRRKREKTEDEFLAKRVRGLQSDASVESQDTADANNWLYLNKKPWNIVLQKWRDTFGTRKALLCNSKHEADLFQKYPHYKEAFGYQLVDIDFHMLHGGNTDGLKKLENAIPKIIRVLNRSYTDEYSKELLAYLQTPDISKDAEITIILILLNNVLKPTKVTLHYKPSILVAQEEIIIFATTDDEAASKLASFYGMYENLGFTIIPKLIFRGENHKSLSGSFELHYKSVVYSLDSALRAVDLLVKFVTIFGLRHSKISRMVWQFLRSTYYEIPGEAEYASIIRLQRTINEQGEN
ncbi:uncharacterized protein LOC131684134 isoform X2 [Topomyia yanbarensis]|nr:uncharacterized protein LOC131684134 isoform X2 [Topomyia yanbarensis]